jgi:uncharacterized protein
MFTGLPAIAQDWPTRVGRYRYWLIGLLTAIALLLPHLSSSAWAQTAYPAWQNPYVNDYAEILTPEEAVNARAELSQFQTQTGKQVVVLTINSIQDYPTGDASLESFATNLFNTWGIGDADRNDGILILVAPGDRAVRIELGRGYPASADRVAQSIIDEAMLPHFREGQMSQGTLAGVAAVVRRFGTDAGTSSSLNRSLGERIVDTAAEVIRELAQGIMLLLGIALFPVFFIFRRWQRFRQRNCPQCQTEMRRLGETEDDRYLEAGQRREETLKSVDYDVWHCPSCGYHTVTPFTNFFSRYQKCPQCRHKTLSVSTETLVRPTYSSTGRARVTEDCRHCSHHRSYTKTLPRLQRSSSSSGSSSHGGGGRSSGGGASGRW